MTQQKSPTVSKRQGLKKVSLTGKRIPSIPLPGKAFVPRARTSGPSSWRPGVCGVCACFWASV